MLRFSPYVTHLTWLAPVNWCIIQSGLKKAIWVVSNPADESPLMKAHFKWCNSKTCSQMYLLHKGKQGGCICVRCVWGPLYIPDRLLHLWVHICVFADVWNDSRYYWNLLIHVWPWGKAQMSLWIRITATYTPTPLHFDIICPCFSFQL